MVDGVVLVVCASEGPMTQTRFVLKKALSRGLKLGTTFNPFCQTDMYIQASRRVE